VKGGHLSLFVDWESLVCCLSVDIVFVHNLFWEFFLLSALDLLRGESNGEYVGVS